MSVNVREMAALRGDVAVALRRAAHQHGRVEIPVKLKTISGQPGNAATLFEVDWYVLPSGQFELTLFVDGVSFWKAKA